MTRLSIWLKWLPCEKSRHFVADPDCFITSLDVHKVAAVASLDYIDHTLLGGFGLNGKPPVDNFADADGHVDEGGRHATRHERPLVKHGHVRQLLEIHHHLVK